MGTEITDQQSALKDAMKRAKKIAATLQQEDDSDEAPAHEDYDSRKRRFVDSEVSEPDAKKTCDDSDSEEDSSDDNYEKSNRKRTDTRKRTDHRKRNDNGIKNNDKVDSVIEKVKYNNDDDDSDEEEVVEEESDEEEIVYHRQTNNVRNLVGYTVNSNAEIESSSEDENDKMETRNNDVVKNARTEAMDDREDNDGEIHAKAESSDDDDDDDDGKFVTREESSDTDGEIDAKVKPSSGDGRFVAKLESSANDGKFVTGDDTSDTDGEIVAKVKPSSGDGRFVAKLKSSANDGKFVTGDDTSDTDGEIVAKVKSSSSEGRFVAKLESSANDGKFVMGDESSDTDGEIVSKVNASSSDGRFVAKLESSANDGKFVMGDESSDTDGEVDSKTEARDNHEVYAKEESSDNDGEVDAKIEARNNRDKHAEVESDLDDKIDQRENVNDKKEVNIDDNNKLEVTNVDVNKENGVVHDEDNDDEKEIKDDKKNDTNEEIKEVETETQEPKPAEKPAPKVIKGPMLVEEIIVPNKFVGLIIGRGGEMINKLQSESGAKIQVNSDSPPDSEDKHITITGAVDSVNKAKSFIDEIQLSGRIPEWLLAATIEGEFTVQIDIPKGKVGLIIGKGGETIKGLQEQAGCRMMMYQDGDYANAPEKPLSISGEESAVMYGKQLIEDLLAGREPESFHENEDYEGGEGVNYKEIDVPKSAVGLVIGSKGSNIHQIQMDTGCKVQFNNEMEGPTKTCMLSGEPYQVAAAEQIIMDIISGNPMPGPRHHMGPRPPFNGPRPGWDGHMGPHGHQGWGHGPPRPSRNTSLPPDHKEMSIEVPANKCGIVIGKGGETIKSIKSETKANLQLNRNVPDNLPFKVFTVTGTDKMIEEVLGMIRSKIQDQSIVAKPMDGSAPMPQQNPWGAPANMGWGQQAQANQWGYQQQAWNGHAGWGQQPATAQNPWGQAQAQATAWNQSMQQPTWDAQTQQWQHQATAAGQWAQQQWSQPAQTYQASATSTVSQTTNPSQATAAANGATAVSTTAAQTATGQPDYSAAWALYYQQQQQYYQQYYQQAAVSSVATGAVSTAVAAPAATQAAAAAITTNDSQAQAMAEYQAKLKEYYKQLGQQPPQ